MKIFILRHEDRTMDGTFFSPLTQDGLDKSIKLIENDFLLHLTALIIHYGNNFYGHYITLYKDKDNKWYEFDDMKSKVIKIGSFNKICDNYNYLSNIVALVYNK